MLLEGREVSDFRISGRLHDPQTWVASRLIHHDLVLVVQLSFSQRRAPMPRNQCWCMCALVAVIILLGEHIALNSPTHLPAPQRQKGFKVAGYKLQDIHNYSSFHFFFHYPHI